MRKDKLENGGAFVWAELDREKLWLLNCMTRSGFLSFKMHRRGE